MTEVKKVINAEDYIIEKYKKSDDGYSYNKGNDTLYKLCSDFPLEKIFKNDEKSVEEKIDALAAQLWLIGRSYAASLERRSYWPYYTYIYRNEADKKISLSQSSGNGLDDYFEEFAKRLILEEYGFSDEFKHIIGLLDNSVYSFKENNETDREVLKNSILAVLKLNRLFKEIRYAIDEDGMKKGIKKFIENRKDESKETKRVINYIIYRYKKEKIDEKKFNIIQKHFLELFKNNQNNIISFCSKFLHFHYPNQVFIKDSITENHFKKDKNNSFIFNFGNIKLDNVKLNDFKHTLNVGMNEEIESMSNEIYNIILKPEDKKNNNSDLIKKMAKNLTENIEELIPKSQNSDEDTEQKYIKHCVTEYYLAKELFKDTNANGRYIPRVIDTYMLMANT